MRKALITGGGGFIGLAVAKQLTGMGIETTVVGRRHYPAAEASGARCLPGDIRDRSFLARAVAGHDTVFHAAAKTGVWGRRDSYFSVNVTGTENVIAACRVNGVKRLIHTSTPSVVFNGKDLEGVEESTPYADSPLCHYAATKITAEKLVLAANSERLKTTAIRPHLVWGPDDPNLIPRLLARGRKGSLRIVGGGANLVDICYIDNAADAHVLAALNLERTGSAAGKAFFISQGEPVVLWDWINDLFARAGVPCVRRRVSFRNAYRAGWFLEKIYGLLCIKSEPKMTRFLAEQLARSHWFSINKAGTLLGYRPGVSTEEGLNRLLAWIETTKA